MTREEAIKEMERMKAHGWCKTEAIDMAIKALEQPEPCEDAISRQAAIDIFNQKMKEMPPERYADYYKGLMVANGVVQGLPSAQPEPCDCVLKQFGECTYTDTGCSDCKVKQKIRAALEQPEPCEDAVSRNLVLSEVKSGMIRTIDGENWKRVNDNVRDIKAMPSVTPQKTGKWIPHESVFGGPGEKVYTCDQCGYNIGFHVENFCPRCGSRNIKEE